MRSSSTAALSIADIGTQMFFNVRRDLAGETLKVREVFERHSGDSRLTFKNYQEALRRLEGHVTVASTGRC
jgi:hypothetical protein